jgi:transcriptional regulator with XRE-family HTH domain
MDHRSLPPAVSPSSSAQEAMRSLCARLRQVRVEAGLTGRALAARTGWHSSKVSKIEHGVQRPSVTDLAAWATACDLPDLAGELVASLHAAEGMFVEWRRMEHTGLAAAQESVRTLWEDTHQFRIYSGWVIPAPIQTAEYITAVLNSVRIRRHLRADRADLAAAVTARLDRQRRVTGRRHRIAIVLEEHVLRNPVGGTTTMIGQLGHLLTAGSQPSISLGIIPIGADRTQTRPVEGFWLFDDTQAAIELVSGYLTITQPHELALYTQAFTELADLAVYGPPARTLIRNALASIDESE